MRPLQRAVGDYHVDRPQVEAPRGVEPSGTNCPNACSRPPPPGGGPRCSVGAHPAPCPIFPPVTSMASAPTRRLLRGGAPLPIPNREVKPRSADDTAVKRGKVGRRPPLTLAFTNGCSMKICGDYCAEAHLFPFRTEKLSSAAPMILR